MGRHRLRGRVWVVAAVTLVAACGSSPSGSGGAEDLAAQSIDEVIAVSSPAFADGSPIPGRYSCDGDDVSPPLSWEDVPDEAVELVLVMDDPDAPGGTYVHWVLFGLDPSVEALGEDEVPAGASQARNSGGNTGYRGPCPPPADDAHHYRFTVYALDRTVTAADGAVADDVLAAVKDDALARGTLTATFDR